MSSLVETISSVPFSQGHNHSVSPDELDGAVNIQQQDTA